MEQADIFQDEQQAARLRAEANFGWREIRSFLECSPKPERVLEVGCGTGLLLSQLSQKFGDISFTGVEPIGSGFSQFENTLKDVQENNKNITFIRKRIEDVTSDKKYDLIYSINVLEHLDDWQKAIDICVSMLRANGCLVILCPNYWVPYESHFSLPIIGTKSATHKVFSRRIAAMEREFGAQGLWDSLNFVTAPQIQEFCTQKGYNIKFDREIMARMLNRLDDDIEFKKRQSGLAKLAGLANRLGAGSVFRMLPPRCSAYMKFVIQKQNHPH